LAAPLKPAAWFVACVQCGLLIQVSGPDSEAYVIVLGRVAHGYNPALQTNCQLTYSKRKR
jgi:hypothetical protein